MDFMIIDIVKVFLPATTAFIVGIALTPFLSHFLYKHQLWKKKSVAVALDGEVATISQTLHRDEEKKTPRMGGVLVWASVLLTIVGFSILAKIFPNASTAKTDFLSRNQTWVPLAVLLIGSLVGLIDDFLDVQGGGDHIAGGLSLKKRLAAVAFLGLGAAFWFYFKLGVSSVMLPVLGAYDIGWLFIPLFVTVVLAIYSGGIIDGIDGLSGGVFAAMFSAYAGIAFYQQQIDLAAFCATIVGAILAFLWFNIPPARFYMSETGMMGLTVALAVVAFTTDSLGEGRGLMALPIVALPLVATTASAVIQILSKKFLKRKVFIVAPLHNHFQAKGWPGSKVTMRYWIVSVVAALLGMIVALIG